MLDWLTPAERRGASLLVVILLIGAAHDGWRTRVTRRATAGTQRLPGATPWDTAGSRPTRPPASTGPSAHGLDEGAWHGPVLNLNRASVEDLDRLPGIGPVLAQRIVAHRLRHGPFSRVEELLAVRGIGPRLFARIQPRVTVERQPAPAASRPVHSAQPEPRTRADSTSVRASPSR